MLSRLRLGLIGAALIGALLGGAAPAAAQVAQVAPPPDGAVRVAVFNVSLSRRYPGALIDELRRGGRRGVAETIEIIQRVRPDILFLNELDYDARGEALALLQAELGLGRGGADPIRYAYAFSAPVNTGVQSGFDLDRDGEEGPGDAWGWGAFEGQFGMALLSVFPIDRAASRTFQTLRWADAAAALGAQAPTTPGESAPYYPDAAWAEMPLSSKSHWDIVVETPFERSLHVLASHPTPPVFDGPEDRNGLRNAAEIAFWRAYIEGAAWIYDDDGRRGGLPDGASFAILGDLNNDPEDGDGRREAIRSLLNHPDVQDPKPASPGGAWAAEAQGGVNARHRGDPGLDTADWRDDGGPGNLRVDYALPSRDLTVVGAGVFWPSPDRAHADLVLGDVSNDEYKRIGSDHRLVYIDILP